MSKGYKSLDLEAYYSKECHPVFFLVTLKVLSYPEPTKDTTEDNIGQLESLINRTYAVDGTANYQRHPLPFACFIQQHYDRKDTETCQRLSNKNSVLKLFIAAQGKQGPDEDTSRPYVLCNICFLYEVTRLVWVSSILC